MTSQYHGSFIVTQQRIKILGIAIRQSKDIKGFCYKRKEIKLSQYADDTQILLDSSEKSVRNTVNLLNNFTKISGI
jgi:hypothetical protein